jgi:ubiquinone/menaquinone biosynthesis C-methylase UbiE
MDLDQQFALPRGLGGAFVGALMARRHGPQIRACVADLAPVAGEHVLEIGFGPGLGLAALAEAAPDLRIAGVDPSELMLASARRRARRLGGGAGGRIALCQAAADELPWPDGTFDGVCATNSVQLWRPLDASLAEVRRVLRPGGRLAVSVLEHAVLHDGGSAGPDYDDTLLPALKEAGFTEVHADWRPAKGTRALHVRAVSPQPV